MGPGIRVAPVRLAIMLAVLVALLASGCVGPPYDASKRPIVGPGATEGLCDGLLEGRTEAVALVRLKLFGRGEQVVLDFNRVQGAYDVDEQGCAAIEFRGTGTYRFYGGGSCTQSAIVEWDGSSILEVYLPYDNNACV